jgi:hypothetical protein
MDDAVRIPIDIAYEAAPAEPDDSDEVLQRTTVLEDGSIVIDMLVPQPCRPEPSTGNEIVVCAQANDDGYGTPDGPAPTDSGQPEVPKAELVLSSNAKLVLRGETDSVSGSQRVMIDFKLKF